MKKEDLVTLRIEDLTNEGLGIGHADGMAVFVKDTVIGDLARVKIIKVKKNYCYGRLEELISPSPDRKEVRCPAARACGGCQLQMLSYPAQLRFKEQKVKNCLVRIGGFDPDTLPMEPILGMEDDPFRYRNKAQYPAGIDREGRLTAGFYAGRTHHIIEQKDCLLGPEENEEILRIILEHMEHFHIMPYNEQTFEGVVRHIMIRKGFSSGQIMVCLVINAAGIPGETRLAAALGQVPGMASIGLNINRERTNVILGKKTRTIWGPEYIEDSIGDVRFQISAASFYQVNPVQTEKLYSTVLSYADLEGTETVWDLYCGIGTISLFLAAKAGKVCGVEIVPQAIEDARRNAALNGFENTEFFVGKAEEILPEKYEREREAADVIVVDPPRKGCDPALLDTIIRMQPQRIVYVSCDPATLARDLKILCEGGYCLQKVQPCDMFPQTVHVETVCLLSNRKPDSYVHLNLKMEDYYRIKDAQKEQDKK